MSSIQEEYEKLPYPHYVHPLSDPARSAVLGRLFGRRPADPRQARVLELGCGSGSNLLTLAARFPGSQFLGLDFSGPDIAAAREVAAEKPASPTSSSSRPTCWPGRRPGSSLTTSSPTASSPGCRMR